MRKIVFYQNIIAPYRIALFNDMELISKTYPDFDFEVLIMRKTRKGRYWNVDENAFSFKYSIGKGIYFSILNKYDFHFNPFQLYYLISEKKEIVLGGSWNNLNVLLLVIGKRIGIVKNKLHIWSEANYLAERTNNFFSKKLRKWVYNSIDGKFLVPGNMSVITFERYNINIKQKMIYFPNLIDSKAFSISEEEISQREYNKKPVIIITARLIEYRKGILNYLKALGKERLNIVKINILGEGKDRALLQDFIKKNELEKDILLHGNLEQKDVINMYKMANIFVLPSFIDPSPLTLVEALHMRLPIIASKRCGNHFEAVVNKKNGILIDPYSKESIIESFEFMLNNKENWRKMGEISYSIAKKKFNSSSVLENAITNF